MCVSGGASGRRRSRRAVGADSAAGNALQHAATDETAEEGGGCNCNGK